MIHEMRRKIWRPYAGTSSYQNYANSAFLLLYSSFPILPSLIYPSILYKFFILTKKIRRSADHLYIFICICIFFLFSCVSRVICLLILAPLKKISWKESKFKTMKRRYASDDGERVNKKLREQSCVRVVFISRIFIHTVCKGNFATQDWIEAGATTRRAFF